MKVKDLMISDSITITSSSSLRKGIELMKDNSIRHMPVITKGRKLKEFITLAYLK